MNPAPPDDLPLPPDDLAFRRWLASRLKRDEATYPGHPLYVPIHEGTSHDPVQRILRDIRLNESGKSLSFISGFSGSGKSTELLRLKNQLVTEGFSAFIADADEYFVINKPVDGEVLLIKLAAAYCDALDRIADIDVSNQSYVERFWHWLTKTEVAMEGVELNAGISAGDPKVAKAEFSSRVKLALKQNDSLQQKVKRAREEKPGAVLTDLRAFFAEITQALRDIRPSMLSPVLILDTLEKVSDPFATTTEVFDSFVSLLTAQLEDLQIPGMHIVLTMPPWIKLRHLGLDHVRLLCAVKLWKNTPKRALYLDGYQRLRSVVRQRFTEAGLQRFFGGANASGERPIVDEIIAASGGQLRDLISLLYGTLLAAKDGPPAEGEPIATAEDVRSVIADHRSNYSRLSDEAVDCLARIAKTRTCSFPNQEPKAILTLTSLFNSHHAFLLPNEEEWCDVHPLTLEAIKRKMKRSKPKATS